MKAEFKKKNAVLGTFLVIVFQIVSSQSLQSTEYEIFLADRMGRNMAGTESLDPTETPFSWLGCLDCFTWHNGEKADNPSMQGSEWNTGNPLKNKVMHPVD